MIKLKIKTVYAPDITTGAIETRRSLFVVKEFPENTLSRVKNKNQLSIRQLESELGVITYSREGLKLIPFCGTMSCANPSIELDHIFYILGTNIDRLHLTIETNYDSRVSKKDAKAEAAFIMRISGAKPELTITKVI